MIKKIESFIVWNILWNNIFKNRYMASPVKAGHKEYTMLYSTHDDLAQPSDYLIDLATKAIQMAKETHLPATVVRINKRFDYPNPEQWPGEHYRLLAAFVKLLQPQVVIEIGTHLGIGTVSLKEYLPATGKLYTFDVIPWHKFSDTLFTEKDFDSGRITQYTDDLSQYDQYKKHMQLFENVDIIFVDAKKDGIMEQIFIDNFNKTAFHKNPLIIFDDIKNWMMLKIWRDIDRPKLDITSFGHFTGTGLVEWSNKDLLSLK